MRENRLDRGAEPWAQQRMFRIGSSFLSAAQPVIFRRWASSQVAVLGKDEPHPVTAFSAAPKLRQRGFENAVRLRIDEALKVERIVVAGHRLPFAKAPPPGIPDDGASIIAQL